MNNKMKQKSYIIAEFTIYSNARILQIGYFCESTAVSGWCSKFNVNEWPNAQKFKFQYKVIVLGIIFEL